MVGVQFNNGESFEAKGMVDTDLDVALLQLDIKPSRGMRPLRLCRDAC